MPLSHDFALLRDSGGEWLVVEGPFHAATKPSKEFPSFYVNCFILASKKPWKIGRRILSFDEVKQLLEGFSRDKSESKSGRGHNGISLNWQPTSAANFSEVFDSIQTRIATGELEKAVPALNHSARIQAGDVRSLLCSLMKAPEGLFPFAYSECQTNGVQRGFLGISPERLLSVHNHRLETVALAGTASPEQANELLSNPKEIREHELVAGYLYDKLATLGKVLRHPRALRDLGSLVHLESLFELELDTHWQAHDLIEKLHPTPALGTQPRTQSALQELNQWRKQLRIPSEFGAPFGYYWQGRLEIVVAIRGIWWHDNQLSLPTGCGIIEQSKLSNELAELELKRDWVAKQLGLS